MAIQNTRVKNTVSGNMQGTLAGVAATVAVGLLSQAGYLTIACAAIGLPEATVSLMAMAIVGGIANYAVTHIAAVKTLNDLYAALPETVDTYPSDKISGVTQGDRE